MTKRIIHGLTLSKIAGVDFPCQEPATAAIIKGLSGAYDTLLKGKYSADDRKTMAGKGTAMSDGSYPIADSEDLHNAIHAVGRGKNNSHAAIRAHIKTRAKSLGLSSEIPDDWTAKVQKKLTLWHDADGKLTVEHDTTPGKSMRKAMCEAITKAGITLTDPDGDEGAQLFDSVLGAETLTQKFWDDFYKGTNALQQSLLSIIKDDDVAEKSGMIDTSLKEFATYIGEILPGEVGKALAAGVAATIAGGARTTDQGDTMSDSLKKALGLPATATEAEMLKAMEDLNTLNKSLVAPLSIEQAAYMAKMATPAEQLDFQKADSKARDAKMKAEPKDDPKEDDVEKAIKAGDAFRTLDGGHMILKSKVGAEQFVILKSMDDGRRSDRALIAKNEDDKIAKAYEDQAVDLGFAKAFAPTLRKALNGDVDAQGLLAKEIKAMRAQIEKGGLFTERGGLGTDAPGSAGAELVAKAQAFQTANPGKSYEQAYAAVYKDRGNAEIVKRYKAEASGTA